MMNANGTLVSDNDAEKISIKHTSVKRMVAWSCKTFHAALTCDSSVSGAPTANRRTNLPDRTCLSVAMIRISGHVFLITDIIEFRGLRMQGTRTVCDMKIFPLELTVSSKLQFTLQPLSRSSSGGIRRKQTSENVRGATTCVYYRVHIDGSICM